MRFTSLICIALYMLLAACGDPRAIGPNLEYDPSNPKAIKLFKQTSQGPINPNDLYGLWEAPLGKAVGVVYSSRLLIEKNFITLAVKCSFHNKNGQVEEELFALADSEAIITRNQIFVERYSNQTVQKKNYLCTSKSSLVDSNYWIDHNYRQLVLETKNGQLRLNKIAENLKE